MSIVKFLQPYSMQQLSNISGLVLLKLSLVNDNHEETVFCSWKFAFFNIYLISICENKLEVIFFLIINHYL